MTNQTTDRFMSRLFEPLPDAELLDRDLERIEKRAAQEAKRQARSAWHCQWLKCRAARAAHDALDYRRIVAAFYPGEAETPDPAELRRLFTAWRRECLKLMRVPAVTKANLNEKRRLVKPLACSRWGDICADEKKLEALVAADEERLGSHRGRA